MYEEPLTITKNELKWSLIHGLCGRAEPLRHQCSLYSQISNLAYLHFVKSLGIMFMRPGIYLPLKIELVVVDWSCDCLNPI